MARKYSIQNLSTLNDRKVFFDANVLIYIFWSSGAYFWEEKYSSVFGKLLRQKNEMVTDFIVISEIVNRAHRLEYNSYLSTNKNAQTTLSYKNYRNSAEGKSALSDIYLIIETNILPHFKISSKSFTKDDILSFLHLDSLDFVDKAILIICQENSFILLTNDADFKFSDIDILTSNSKILN